MGPQINTFQHLPDKCLAVNETTGNHFSYRGIEIGFPHYSVLQRVVTNHLLIGPTHNERASVYTISCNIRQQRNTVLVLDRAMGNTMWIVYQSQMVCEFTREYQV